MRDPVGLAVPELLGELLGVLLPVAELLRVPLLLQLAL